MATSAFNLHNVFFHREFLASILTVFFSVGLHAEPSKDLEMEQWLKARFGAQHQELMPVVAVADMVYSCEKERQIGTNLPVKALLTQVDKNALAEQLIVCLAGESPKSDIALNYGLSGCFYEQLADLPQAEKQQKMRLVTQAIAALSREERQKSFTQCVTDQAIHYLR